MLNRAEEAARSSKDVLVGVALSRDNKIKRSDSHSDDDEWQSDHVFDSIASDSPRRGRCTDIPKILKIENDCQIIEEINAKLSLKKYIYIFVEKKKKLK